MRAGDTLRFLGISETAMVGGGDVPLASDVGLWVVDSGVLDAQGSTKESWAAGRAPLGVLPTDELVTTPVAMGDYTNFPLFTGTVPVSPWGHQAEVLNLTRDCRIEGTPGGRTHIFIKSTQPQVLRYVGIRYVGPRSNETTIVLGRYGLHLHKGGEGPRGTVVEGVVIRDCGSKSFVPHSSHGTTFRDCIAFNGAGDAYWWDLPADAVTRNATDDTLWDHCVAAKLSVPQGDPDRGNLSGFNLGEGVGNACNNCVAVGVSGSSDSAGYVWPAPVGKDTGIWVFEDDLAHNNSKHGAFVWQNANVIHPVARFDTYGNGESGLDHGAYIDPFQYVGGRHIGNGLYGLLLHGGGGSDALMCLFTDEVYDGGGRSPQAAYIIKHSTTCHHVRWLRVDLRGFTAWPIQMDERTLMPGFIDFVDCTVNGTLDLEAADFHLGTMHPESVYRVQRRDGTAYQLKGPNATVTTIGRFWP